MRKFIVLLLLILVIGSLIYYQYYYSKQQSPKDAIKLYGNVDVRQVDLGFRVPGRVDKMFFEEGNFVPAGKLMAIMDRQPYRDQVLEAEANLESVKTSLLNSERIFKRREELIGEGGVSREDFENMQSSLEVFRANLKQAEAALGVAKSNLSYTELYSPSPGIILTRVREPGTVVNASDPIYTLTLISPVWIRAFVTEQDLGLIYPNMPATIYTDTPGGKVYQGHIGFISPVSEFTPKTVETTQLRTDLVYRLRVIADNPDEGLRQGMPVTVLLKLKESKK